MIADETIAPLSINNFIKSKSYKFSCEFKKSRSLTTTPCSKSNEIERFEIYSSVSAIFLKINSAC